MRAAMLHGIEHDADMVALFPGLEFGSPVEAVVQQTMVLALGLFFPFDKAMDPDYPDTLTGGAFMLVRRSLYDSFGGHEAVKGFVIEDLNLGRTVKKHRGKIRIAIAEQLLRCRMYEGWTDMWEGLTKNAYAGLEYKMHIALVAIAGIVVANILSPVYLIAAIVWAAIQPTSGVAWVAVTMSVVLILLQARPMNQIRLMLQLSWPYAFAVPPGSFLYLLITIGSMWQYYRRGNVWKGRSYNRQALADEIKT
jgi:chlorobactene glucosyltransferase